MRGRVVRSASSALIDEGGAVLRFLLENAVELGGVLAVILTVLGALWAAMTRGVN
jgi:hypothetical protein